MHGAVLFNFGSTLAICTVVRSVPVSIDCTALLSHSAFYVSICCFSSLQLSFLQYFSTQNGGCVVSDTAVNRHCCCDIAQ